MSNYLFFQPAKTVPLILLASPDVRVQKERFSTNIQNLAFHRRNALVLIHSLAKIILQVRKSNAPATLALACRENSNAQIINVRKVLALEIKL